MRTAIGFVFVAALLGAVDASAALVTFNEAVAGVCLGTLSGPDCGIVNQAVSVPNGTAFLTGTFGSAGAGAQMTANISATSGYGVLHAASSSTVNLTGSPRVASAAGDALFEDILTISFGPLNGSPGILLINYNLDGIISGSGVDKSFAEVMIEVGPSLPSLAQFYGAVYNSSTSGLVAVPQVFTFTYGQPFGMLFSLDAITGTGGSFVTGTGTGTTDFSDTLVLSGLIVEDQNGNPVPGASFSSASGTVYGPNGVVPEPSPAVLALTAIALLWAGNKRLRQSVEK